MEDMCFIEGVKHSYQSDWSISWVSLPWLLIGLSRGALETYPYLGPISESIGRTSSHQLPDVFNVHAGQKLWSCPCPSGWRAEFCNFRAYSLQLPHLILMVTQPWGRSGEVSDLFLEMQELITQEDSLTCPTKVAQLRKGRARTQAAASGSRLTALPTSLSETGTFRFSKLSFSYSFKETWRWALSPS